MWSEAAQPQPDWSSKGFGIHYFAIVMTCIAVAVVAMFNFQRFTLRTLLIATTLVAVGLGTIVWLNR